MARFASHRDEVLLTIEVLFLRPFQCPFVREPGQEVFGESLGRSSQWLSCPRQGTAGSEIPLKQLEPKATTNEYLEAPKERSNRPLLRSIANDGDAPKERTRRGQWYVLHDRLTEFQFRPLRVLSLGASPTTAMLLRRGQIALSLGACQGQRRGS